MTKDTKAIEKFKERLIRERLIKEAKISLAMIDFKQEQKNLAGILAKDEFE